METQTKESPTITQKLCAILQQPWNRALREESLARQSIERLRGEPLKTEFINESARERGARWSEDLREQPEADLPT